MASVVACQLDPSDTALVAMLALPPGKQCLLLARPFEAKKGSKKSKKNQQMLSIHSLR